MKPILLLDAVCVLQRANAWLKLGSALSVTEKPQDSLPILQHHPGNGEAAAGFGGKWMVHSNTAMAPMVENCASWPDVIFFQTRLIIKLYL